MDIPLNIPANAQQREFLDYLNAALRRKACARKGWIEDDEGGSFVIGLSGPFPVDDRQVQLTWLLKRTASGSLEKISVSADEQEAQPEVWQQAVRDFVTSVLTATLAAKKTRFFRQSVFFYLGPQLEGEYWLPGFRFAPVCSDDSMPTLINAERAVTIDQYVYAVDEFHAYALADASAWRHAARLTLLLDLALYRDQPSMRWVLAGEDGKPLDRSIRYQLGFRHPNMALGGMPKKGEICRLGTYRRSLEGRLQYDGPLTSLPKESRAVLRGIEKQDPVILNGFDRACRLYQVSCVSGNQFPSVGMAYEVAAVEALSSADPDNVGFSNFMRRYVTPRPDTEISRTLEYLYGNVRSGHFHSGSFPFGEFDCHHYFDPLMDLISATRDMNRWDWHALVREAIVNWMRQKLLTEISRAS